MEPTTGEDLLEAIKEFDRLADRLDLTGDDPLRVALRAGRKLSRIARAAVIPPGPPAREERLIVPLGQGEP